MDSLLLFLKQELFAVHIINLHYFDTMQYADNGVMYSSMHIYQEMKIREFYLERFSPLTNLNKWNHAYSFYPQSYLTGIIQI